MGISNEDLAASLAETTKILDKLTTTQTELREVAQRHAQEFAELKAKAPSSPAQKTKIPTPDTHSYEDITRWYREQLHTLIQAGKAHEKTATSEPSRPLSK